MHKYILFVFLLLLPLMATWLAVHDYPNAGLALHGLSLIIFIAAAGIFSIRILLSLFKQDHETAVKAVIGLIVALGMVLLTAVLMAASNPNDRARTSGRSPEGSKMLLLIVVNNCNKQKTARPTLQ